MLRLPLVLNKAALKHKVLLAVDQQTDTESLLNRVEGLLNKSHTKYLSLILLDELFKQKLVTANASGYSGENILKKIEYEVNFEKEATARWMNLELARDISNFDQLATQSTVADLVLFERQSILDNYGEDQLNQLVSAVNCPVAILPDHEAHDSIIVVHDGSMKVVPTVKSFINMFSLELRQLPVSVFVSDPDNNFQIDSEKVFIDYLKLYFKDIGIQLMDCDAAVCLKDHIRKEHLRPILLMNATTCSDFIHQKIFNSKITKNAATFIFKG